MTKHRKGARASISRRDEESKLDDHMSSDAAAGYLGRWANEQNEIAAHNQRVFVGELMEYAARREMPRTTSLEALREERTRDVATGRPVRAGARRRADCQSMEAAASGGRVRETAQQLIRDHPADYILADGRLRYKLLCGRIADRLSVSERTVRRRLPRSAVKP